jgi:Domain of unknown function (DUF4920)
MQVWHWTGAAVLVGALSAGVVGAESTKYGEGVSLKEATPIADLMARPDEFVGKKIRVDGIVSAVCEEMGCWIELKEPDGAKALRFKVEDGVIVFPISAKGKKASAEGTFEKLDLAKATEHQAADMKADPASGGTVTYLVRATGAVVY